MAHWNKHYWKAFGSIFLAFGAQLIASSEAVAHGGSHGEVAEPEANADAEEHHVPPPDAATRELPNQANRNEMIMPSSDLSVEADPSTQAASVASISKASLSEGFSLGIGESLLGLLIAGPFLLMSLKKRFQS
ncbi:MAG: hypothetical protein WBA10_21075 [Elainellaceae cyanobacterium]